MENAEKRFIDQNSRLDEPRLIVNEGFWTIKKSSFPESNLCVNPMFNEHIKIIPA